MRDPSTKSRVLIEPRGSIVVPPPDAESLAEETRSSSRPNGRLRRWNAGLAARLKKVAGTRGLREIGSLTQTNPETVRRYMRDGNPCARFLASFSREFGVSADWLLGIEPRSQTRRPPSKVTRVRLTLAVSKNRVRVLGEKAPVTGGPRKSIKVRGGVVRAAGGPVPPPGDDPAPFAASSGPAGIHTTEAR